jgi:hypothetical protein
MVCEAYYYCSLEYRISVLFAVRSGVREGSVLSPSLFDVFVNVIIFNLKRADIDCHVYGQFMRCALFALR